MVQGQEEGKAVYGATVCRNNLAFHESGGTMAEALTRGYVAMLARLRRTSNGMWSHYKGGQIDVRHTLPMVRHGMLARFASMITSNIIEELGEAQVEEDPNTTVKLYKSQVTGIKFYSSSSDQEGEVRVFYEHNFST